LEQKSENSRWNNWNSGGIKWNTIVEGRRSLNEILVETEVKTEKKKGSNY
jgi:hypothetical protein